MSEWINVKDRLPNELGYYLVACNKFKYGLANAREYAVMHCNPLEIMVHRGFSCDAGTAVTHWMPLPEPPEVQI